MQNPNKSLNLDVIEFEIDGLFDSRRISDNQYMLPVTPIIIRELNNVEYIFGAYNGYLLIFGKNTTVDGYLPIGGENMEDVIMSLVTNDKERFNDIESFNSNKVVNIDSDIIYGIDIVESINAINAFSEPSNNQTTLSYEDYIGKLKEYVGKAVAWDELNKYDLKSYLKITEEFLRFGAANTVDMSAITNMDGQLVGRLYLLQLAFVDRCAKASDVILKLSKSVFTADEINKDYKPIN